MKVSPTQFKFLIITNLSERRFFNSRSTKLFFYIGPCDNKRNSMKNPDDISTTKLRSAEWFGKSDKMGFVHRSWLRNQGYPDDYFQGKPVIGICNTWSELTPCNGHLRDFAE